MTIPGVVIKKIIRRLLASEDYRVEIVKLIDDDFLQYVIKFFGRVVDAKLKDRPVTIDWYKEEFLNENLPKEEIAINSGLNLKTISNMLGVSQLIAQGIVVGTRREPRLAQRLRYGKLP